MQGLTGFPVYLDIHNECTPNGVVTTDVCMSSLHNVQVEIKVEFCTLREV